jgi:two-component system, chemotaxis family, chemotaxis protein CheY
MKALIVDDSRAMRTLLRSMCQNLAYDTVEAPDGREALAQARENQPLDIALVDWDMPVMNGFELLKELRSDGAFADTKIMMVTAHNNMDDVVAAMTEGADDFLMKPLTEEMFIDKMRLLGLTN